MTTLAAILHTFSPFVVRFSDGFGIRWYGLSYVAAFAIGWWLWRGIAKRGRSAIPAHRVADAMMIVIVGTIVGGRLGYALVYDRALFTEFTSSPPWWGLLAINKGGMASHGGLMGLVAAAWVVARGFRDRIDADGVTTPARGGAGSADSATGRSGRCSTLHIMDILGLIAPPGLLLGRVANFINGELLGRIVAPPGEGARAPWWSVQFPQELLGWRGPGVIEPRSHTPALSSEQERLLWETTAKLRLPSDVGWGSAIDRLVAKASAHEGVLRQILSSRHPSQLYQAAAEGVVLGLALWFIWTRPLARRCDGVVAGSFFLIYGILRIVTEVWRLPDAQFAEGRPLGLSRGQWLSAAMIAAGIGIIVYGVRKGKALTTETQRAQRKA
ncbi:MAG: prolipoprotein diacylglyceryl transferase [Phycisphaerales bacterium]